MLEKSNSFLLVKNLHGITFHFQLKSNGRMCALRFLIPH
jgi:hypothetical protein